MTDPASSRRRLGPLPVVVAALAAFLAMLTFLAVRVRTGHDPALASNAASAPAPPVRHVLVRRLIERRVVIKIKPAPEPDDGAPATTQAPTPTTASTSSPAQSESAPAPAPAPAPVATRSS